MIRLRKDKVDERFNISDEGVITDLEGNIQEQYLHQGRLTFKKQCVHKILMYTKIGYRDSKQFAIHHIDHNPLNNNINNLVYLTRSEHSKLHHTGKTLSIETRKRLSESKQGIGGKRVKCLENGKIYESRKAAAEDLHCNSEHICAILRGKRHSTRGYHFINVQ